MAAGGVTAACCTANAMPAACTALLDATGGGGGCGGCGGAGFEGADCEIAAVR